MIYSITDDSYIPHLEFNLRSVVNHLTSCSEEAFFDDGVLLTEKELRRRLKDTSIINIYYALDSDWKYKLVTHR